MKVKSLFTALIVITIISCTKDENNMMTSSSGYSVDNQDNLLSRNSSTRYLTWVGSGPGEVEPDCLSGRGNCLPTFEVTARAMYEGFVLAVKSDTQMEFFSKVNYLDVFTNNELNQIEASHQIQDALEKGHLKFRIEGTATTDYCLVIKPQHEYFDLDKLADKVVIAIPISIE